MRDQVPPSSAPARATNEQRRAVDGPTQPLPTAPAVPVVPVGAGAPAANGSGALAAAAAASVGLELQPGALAGGSLAADGSPAADGRAGAGQPGRPALPGVSLSPPEVIAESDVRTHSPAAAQPTHHLGIWAEELGELPWSYGDGRLVALLRDPRTVYVYWDLSDQQVEQAFANLGPARAALKLWSSAQDGEFLREVDVHLDARGWYVRDLPPGVELRVELWALGERGSRMIRAARPVRLPQAETSTVWDEIYVTLPLGRRLGRGESLTSGQPLQWRAGQSAPEAPAPVAPAFLGSSENPGGGRDQLGGGSGSAGLFRKSPAKGENDTDRETK